ncbi:dehydrogenase/reductase SDR family member on chromosome X isoform X1 [Gossypium australe]|uniref:Dehydrogenase/reductase SDR family member on chromosome X isoform X1 n=1 Tax=Gossypium australe TaxID=47621 RepID=A0A5B6WUS2_9ROSI|nr:dehydrogenase/reductase SDR family member on chromosome X isoform X1 [Gossypium australe]
MIKGLKEALRFAASISFWRMAVFWIISLFISYFQLHTNWIFSRRLQSYPRCHPPISESPTPVCIITGATSGLGAAAAHALSREGFFVVLVGRSSHLLSKIMTEIKTQNKDAHVKAFVVDLASFQSILEFKSSLQQWLLDCKLHCSLQLLINNAGILATSSRTTPEGYDQMMGTNYIGPFCLTKLLLPLLKRSPVPSRIVDKESVSGTRFLRSEPYPFVRLYEYSKLFLILFSYELHRQLGLMDQPYHVSVNAADPGSVKTNIMREVPSCLSSLAFQVLKSLGLLQSPKNGVSSLIDAALAPPEASGVYFFGGKGRTVDSSVLSHNTKLAKELWEISDNLFMEASLAFKETASSESDNWL